MINKDNIDEYIASAAYEKMQIEESYINAKKNYEYLKDRLEDANVVYNDLTQLKTNLK